MQDVSKTARRYRLYLAEKEETKECTFSLLTYFENAMQCVWMSIIPICIRGCMSCHERFIELLRMNKINTPKKLEKKSFLEKDLLNKEFVIAVMYDIGSLNEVATYISRKNLPPLKIHVVEVFPNEAACTLLLLKLGLFDEIVKIAVYNFEEEDIDEKIEKIIRLRQEFESSVKSFCLQEESNNEECLIDQFSSENNIKLRD